MINRAIIRLKVVQLIFSYYMNQGKNVDSAEKELLFSLSKAYDLYNHMLLLIVAVSRHAAKHVELQERNNKVAHIDEVVSHRFVENRFATQLERNKQLMEYVEAKKKSWENDSDYVKKLYADIEASEYYKEYMALESTTYADDREIWRKIYKNIVMKDERIDDIIEDQSLYWNDDRVVVDTFVIKTIKRFAPENDVNQELMPEYNDIEDRDFATRLFRRCILNDEYYRSLIQRCSRNWDFNRLAYMDIIIMQVAIAEMLSFPQIPISVTINEYVEIAKWYSTPKSSGYVNGIIDAVAKMLKREGKLLKE